MVKSRARQKRVLSDNTNGQTARNGERTVDLKVLLGVSAEYAKYALLSILSSTHCGTPYATTEGRDMTPSARCDFD